MGKHGKKSFRLRDNIENIIAVIFLVMLIAGLAFIYLKKESSIGIRIIFIAMTALIGYIAAKMTRDMLRKWPKQRECTQPVEASVLSYDIEIEKTTVRTDKTGFILPVKVWRPKLEYVIDGTPRNMCAGKYNRFFKRRMEKLYPIGGTVTVYVCPDDPDYASTNCGLTLGRIIDDAISVIAYWLFTAIFAALSVIFFIYGR